MRFLSIILISLLSLALTLKAQTRDTQVVSEERIDLIKSVELFPNPATDFVHVRMDQLPMKNMQLSIHNIIGNEMFVETEVIGAHELRVKVKDLAAGYYLLALKDEENKFKGTYKFVKR